MLGGLQGKRRELLTEGAYGAFEQMIKNNLGGRMTLEEDLCRELWSALANISWVHPEYGEVGYSFRAAGDLIAAVIDRGDYMDWYCSGPHAIISERIEEIFMREGWEPIKD